MDEYKENDEISQSSINKANKEDIENIRKQQIESSFLQLFNLCIQHFNENRPFLACEICGRLFVQYLHPYCNISKLFDSPQKTSIFVSLLHSSFDSIDKSIYPLLCISSILTNNRESVTFFEENDLLSLLSHYLNILPQHEDEDIFIQLSRLILSCYQTMLNFDENLRIEFLQNDDFQNIINILPSLSSKEDSISLSYIGFIFSSIIDDIESFEESIYFDEFINLFQLLLNNGIFDACFCFFDKLMYFQKAFHVLINSETITKIFDSWPNIIEIFHEISEQESCNSQESHQNDDPNNKEVMKSDANLNRMLTNALVILVKILQSTDDSIDLSHFPLNEIIEISLSQHKKYNLMALDVLYEYCNKSMENSVQILENPIITLILQKTDSLSYQFKDAVCKLFLKILLQIPTTHLRSINNDIICFLIDFIEEDMNEHLLQLSIVLDKLLSNNYDLTFLIEFEEKLNSYCDSEEDYEFFKTFLSFITKS